MRSLYKLILLTIFIGTSSFSLKAQDNSGGELQNVYNTKRSIVGYLAVDFERSEFDENFSIIAGEILSVNLFFPIADSHLDEKVNDSHGIIINTGYKISFFSADDFRVIDNFLDLGVGYGYNLNDFRFYGTLNRSVFVGSYLTVDGSLEDSVSEFFPSDFGYFRIGAFWTPIELSSGNKFGFHVAVDNFFEDLIEGSFLIGISVR